MNTKKKKTWPRHSNGQPSARCEPYTIGWDVPRMPSAGFLTAIIFLLPALLAALLLSGCVTGKDKQLAEYLKRQVKNIEKTGAQPGELKTVMMAKAAARLYAAVDPKQEAKPLIVDEVNPGPTDAKIIDATIEGAEEEEERWGTWLAMGGVLVTAVFGGKRAISGVLASRGKDKIIDQLGEAFVCVVDKFKDKLKDGVDAGEIARSTTREHSVKTVVDAKFEEVKNGGKAT